MRPHSTARDEVEACGAAHDAMVATVASAVHDAMSALSVIKATAQHLRQLNQAGSAATYSVDVNRRLELIESAVDRAVASLSGLTQLGRTGRLPPSRSRVDLAALLRRTVRDEQELADDHLIRIVNCPAVLEGPWDGDRLWRLLSNLIGNAIKYSARGQPVDVALDAELDANGQWAVLTVADHGIGIPSTDIPFVFKPFQRGSNVGSIDGSGLGLACVWQIIKEFDGRLCLTSEEGSGTCVTVRLPYGKRPGME